EEIVFSGDALFKESIGRTDLPTGNFDELINSIKENLFSLPNYQIFLNATVSFLHILFPIIKEER
ncbi:hypothetical protein LGW64_08415, partial [Streptococcus mutans]|nr:hypothetical protein [Streptococcus mutans]